MPVPSDMQLVAVATPVLLALVGLELVVGRLQGRRDYTRNATLATLALAAVNVAVDLAVRGVWLLALGWAWEHRLLTPTPGWAYWVTLAVSLDLILYLLHRADHRYRLLWAVHATHHSAAEFNLTVGFRPSVLQPVYRYAWFLPLAVVGYRPADVLLAFAAAELYGVLVHTRCVGRLGPLEWVLCTPSHHRVHHGTNPEYRDRNFGTMFIVWDRLFGTFIPEADEPRYGVADRTPTDHPVRLIWREWADLRVRQPAADGDAPGAGAAFAGVELQKGGLAHAVATDQAGAGGAKRQAEAGEQ